MNYEHRKLGLAGTKSIPSRWGEGFDSIQNVDVKHTRKASIDRLDRYKAGGTASMFSENAKRALAQVVGEDFFTTEAISLSGYIVDFEILLDSNNRPVRIPRRWKRQWKESVISSIYSNRVRIRKKASQVSSLIEKLEGAETSTECVTLNDAVLDSKFDLRMRINLASDWGSKFEAIPRRVTRRIAIEVDGIIHFAANCDHEMGRTVIKHRQLRALGWEVLQVRVIKLTLLFPTIPHPLPTVSPLSPALPSFPPHYPPSSPLSPTVPHCLPTIPHYPPLSPTIPPLSPTLSPLSPTVSPLSPTLSPPSPHYPPLSPTIPYPLPTIPHCLPALPSFPPHYPPLYPPFLPTIPHCLPTIPRSTLLSSPLSPTLSPLFPTIPHSFPIKLICDNY